VGNYILPPRREAGNRGSPSPDPPQRSDEVDRQTLREAQRDAWLRERMARTEL